MKRNASFVTPQVMAPAVPIVRLKNTVTAVVQTNVAGAARHQLAADARIARIDIMKSNR